MQRAISKRTNKYSTGSILSCCQSVYQADSIMAGRIVSGKSQILIRSDSDQAALLGPACICLKDWKFMSNKKNTTINELEIFMATNKTFENILSLLNIPLENNSNVIKPRYRKKYRALG
jgi:hypothetical protein